MKKYILAPMVLALIACCPNRDDNPPKKRNCECVQKEETTTQEESQISVAEPVVEPTQEQDNSNTSDTKEDNVASAEKETQESESPVETEENSVV